MSEERYKREAARIAYEQQFGRKAPEWKTLRPRGQATPLNVPLPHSDPAYEAYIIEKFGPRRRDQA
jgi:hypothetical protein